MDELTLKNLIARELGLEGAPEDVLDDAVAQIGQSIMERTTLAILERLTPEDQEEYGRIAETGEYEKAHEFASSKIENFQEFVLGEARAEIGELKNV